MVYRYAEEIFTLGREMQDALRGKPTNRPAKLLVGISDAVPKIVCHRLLKTALDLEEPVELVLHEGKTNGLLAALAVQEYDMVLTDAPLGPPLRVKAFNHSLGGCGIGFFGEPSLAKRHRRNFPKGLDDAPMLLPTSNTTLRHSLDRWFESVGVRPTPIAEIEDTALMKVFGQHGTGHLRRAGRRRRRDPQEPRRPSRGQHPGGARGVLRDHGRAPDHPSRRRRDRRRGAEGFPRLTAARATR